jgi:hypothetical protein
MGQYSNERNCHLPALDPDKSNSRDNLDFMRHNDTRLRLVRDGVSGCHFAEKGGLKVDGAGDLRRFMRATTRSS